MKKVFDDLIIINLYLIAFSGDFRFDSMIEDSGVSAVNEAFGVDGNPFGVGQADGVNVLCQTGLRL